METIHIMDISFSIRQHLMAYGDIASLESNDSKGVQWIPRNRRSKLIHNGLIKFMDE